MKELKKLLFAVMLMSFQLSTLAQKVPQHLTIDAETKQIDTYEAKQTITVDTKFTSEASVELLAGERIELSKGFRFSAKDDITFHASLTSNGNQSVELNTLNQRANELTISSGLMVYPTITTVETKIRYEVMEGPVELNVYNQSGQSVMQLSEESTTSGYFEHSLDLSRLLPGVYFVELQNGNQKQTARFVKE